MPLPANVWNIDYHQEGWYWDACALESTASAYGTPAYLFSNTKITESLSAWTEASAQSTVPFSSFFSLKTTPVSGILRLINHAGIGAEVVSRHELLLAIHCGFRGEQILYGGTGRDGSDMKNAVEAGVRLVVLDTVEEIRTLAGISTDSGAPIPVALRLMLDVGTGKTARINRTSVATNHFGLDPASGEFRESLRICRETESIHLVGLQSHIGTGLHDVSGFAQNLHKLSALYMTLRSQGHPLSIIDIGGGLGIPTVREFSALEFLRYAAFGILPKAPTLNAGNYIDQYMSAITRAYRDVFSGNESAPSIFLEPGRALTSSAGALLCRVHHVRKRGKKCIAVTDAGALSTGLSVLAEYHEVLPLLPPTTKKHRRYTLTGKTPTSLDLLYLNKRMPPLQGGDLLLVMDAGAYMIPTATNLACLKPPVILLDQGKSTVLQRRETLSDLESRDTENSSYAV